MNDGRILRQRRGGAVVASAVSPAETDHTLREHRLLLRFWAQPTSVLCRIPDSPGCESSAETKPRAEVATSGVMLVPVTLNETVVPVSHNGATDNRGAFGEEAQSVS